MLVLSSGRRSEIVLLLQRVTCSDSAHVRKKGGQGGNQKSPAAI